VDVCPLVSNDFDVMMLCMASAERGQRCSTSYSVIKRCLISDNPTPSTYLQAQVEATEKLLSAEQAANAGLRAQTSELSSELGSVKETLADTAAQLEEERSSGNELRSQLEAIKSEYITAGGARLCAGNSFMCESGLWWRCLQNQVVHVCLVMMWGPSRASTLQQVGLGCWWGFSLWWRCRIQAVQVCL
jgi:hypothetical protein